MENQQIEDLIVREMLGMTLSEKEQLMLKAWLEADKRHRQRYDELHEQTFSSKRYEQYWHIDTRNAYRKFIQMDEEKRLRTANFWWRCAAAILLPLLVAGSAYLYFHQPQQNKEVENLAIVPGSTQATLQTPDGKTLEFDREILAEAAPDTDVSITKTAHGIVMKQTSSLEEALKHPAAIRQQNVLQTARNGEFQITLEDGTLVHLNYNTVLRFPEHFSDRDRIVYLDGEAFFQVAKDKERPFKVITPGIVIKEYGTSFNVNTYSPQCTEVVLVEGCIGIEKGQKEIPLKPGERARFDRETSSLQVDAVDVSTYIAWHQGRFIFDNERLGDIMETLSHWYNVTVIFENPNLQDLHFTGNLDRYGNLSPILSSISRTVGLHIKIEGKTIHIFQ